ncbi:MAG: S49 family peptidase, partial [Sutterellaceae bacterium]|nr:S49 family peptidase [Sutterellaceae bacterium]
MFGFIKNVLRAAWTILDFMRRAVGNFIVLALVVGLLCAAFYESAPAVADKTILTVNLSGNIVEQSELSGSTVSALLSGSEPETRLRDVVRALDLAGKDDRIVGVLIRLDDLESAGLASLREIGVAMDRFKTTGKKITVWSTAYSQRQYAVASHASEVFMHPMGQVMIKGLASQRLYWGDALKKLGVTMHVFKAGEFKSAPEPYVLRKPSQASQEADAYWMTDAWQQLSQSIETSRGLIPNSVQKMIDDLPAQLEKVQGNFSQLALNESLIDAITTEDEVRDMLLERQGKPAGYRLETMDYLTYLAANPEGFSAGKQIAVVTVEGEIKDGVDGPGMTGDRSAVSRIRAAAADPSVGALIVRVDSPGGSAVASER